MKWLILGLLVPTPAAAQALLDVADHTVTFEDVLSEGSSDEDRNDVGVRVNAVCTVDASNRLVRYAAQVTPLTAGASLVNTLVLTLPAVPDHVVVSREGWEDEQPAPAVEVALYEDFRDGFFGTVSGFVNTVPGPLHDGRPTLVVAEFAPSLVLTSGCPAPDFTVRRPGTEITMASTIGDNERPLSGSFPGVWRPPTERTPIHLAYDRFLSWVEQREPGCEPLCPDWDWYTDTDGDLTPLGIEAHAPLLPTHCIDGAHNEDESGVDCGGADCETCPLPPGNLVFVTSTSHDLLTLAPGGSLALGADNLCATHASNAGLPGSFMAWLGLDDGTSPSTRFTRSAGPYILVDGTPIADDWADLVDGGLAHAIDTDELGQTHAVKVLTGLGPDGAVGFSFGNPATCASWTTKASNGPYGIMGNTANSNSGWTWWTSTQSTCSGTYGPYHLYCFEQ